MPRLLSIFVLCLLPLSEAFFARPAFSVSSADLIHVLTDAARNGGKLGASGRARLRAAVHSTIGVDPSQVGPACERAIDHAMVVVQDSDLGRVATVASTIANACTANRSSRERTRGGSQFKVNCSHRLSRNLPPCRARWAAKDRERSRREREYEVSQLINGWAALSSAVVVERLQETPLSRSELSRVSRIALSRQDTDLADFLESQGVNVASRDNACFIRNELTLRWYLERNSQLNVSCYDGVPAVLRAVGRDPRSWSLANAWKRASPESFSLSTLDAGISWLYRPYRFHVQFFPDADLSQRQWDELISSAIDAPVMDVVATNYIDRHAHRASWGIWEKAVSSGNVRVISSLLEIRHPKDEWFGERRMWMVIYKAAPGLSRQYLSDMPIWAYRLEDVAIRAGIGLQDGYIFIIFGLALLVLVVPNVSRWRKFFAIILVVATVIASAFVLDEVFRASDYIGEFPRSSREAFGASVFAAVVGVATTFWWLALIWRAPPRRSPLSTSRG